MNAATWAGIVGLLLTGGVGVAIVNWAKDWAKDRKQGPITARDAHVAAADTLREMAMKVAADAVERADKAMVEAAKARAEGNSDRERIRHLEASHTTLRAQLRRVAAVMVREVAAVLDWVDAGASPPPPSRDMAVIRDVIQQLDRDDAAPPPSGGDGTKPT